MTVRPTNPLQLSSSTVPAAPGRWLVIALLSLVVTFSAASEETGPPAARAEAWATILEVLQSPRCLNCHPNDDVPRQGESFRRHGFGVERGAADHGGPVQQCATCHRDENNSYSRIPGAPHWGLAPRSMGWIGLTGEELRIRLLDPEQNGGRSVEELVEHMTHDKLVLWAWEPGEGRKPPPVPLEEFRAALRQWLASFADPDEPAAPRTAEDER